MERYGGSLHTQSESGKLRTRKNSVYGHFSSSGYFENNVWNMFKVNNKDNRATPLTLFWCLWRYFWTDMSHRSGVCIIDFEQVIADLAVKGLSIHLAICYFKYINFYSLFKITFSNGWVAYRFSYAKRHNDAGGWGEGYH